MSKEISLADIVTNVEDIKITVEQLNDLLVERIDDINEDESYWMPGLPESNPFTLPIKKSGNWPPVYMDGCFSWNIEYILGPVVHLDRFITDGVKMYPNLKVLSEKDPSFEPFYNAIRKANPDLDLSKPIFTTPESLINLNQPDLVSNNPLPVLKTLYNRLEAIKVSRTMDATEL